MSNHTLSPEELGRFTGRHDLTLPTRHKKNSVVLNADSYIVGDAVKRDGHWQLDLTIELEEEHNASD